MIPRLVIAGTRSGVGKTSFALGLMAALKSRGLRVQAFKVGPDYLDPVWHKLATGRVSYNLDTWMLNREYVRSLFLNKTADADIAIIEGVMGLFDGASPTSIEGSTAEIANLLEAPVLLVADAHGASRSFAACVKGFSEFESSCHIAAVVANYCGSSRHASILQEALTGAGLCDLIGSFSKNAFLELPSRHLGLRSPEQGTQDRTIIDSLGIRVGDQVDLDAICKLANHRTSRNDSAGRSKVASDEDRGTLAVAVDDAFSFYYPDSLELLQRHGLRIVEFSPINDSVLPDGIDGVYIGGGYPEEYARQLSQNVTMRESLVRFAEAGKLIYAECGGMMYLAHAVIDRQGQSWPMVGILPFSTRMLDRRKRLGYVETTLAENTLFGPPRTVLRGHEFHYSEIVEPFELQDWRQPYVLRDARGGGERREGFARGNILVSYVHQHLHSNPTAAENLSLAIAGR